MNMNQVWSMVRMALSFGGGILVTFGFLTSSQLSTAITSIGEILGPLSVLASLVWSLFIHTKTQTVKAAADIVQIPVHEQAKAGILAPIVVPTSPPAPSTYI